MRSHVEHRNQERILLPDIDQSDASTVEYAGFLSEKKHCDTFLRFDFGRVKYDVRWSVRYVA